MSILSFINIGALSASSGVGVLYISPHIKSIFYPNTAISINIKLTLKQQQMRLQEIKENMKSGKYKTQFTQEEQKEIDNLLFKEDFERFWSNHSNKHKINFNKL